MNLCAVAVFLTAAASIASAQITSLDPTTLGKPSQPVTARQRLDWVAAGTIGPASLIGGTFSAGWGTLFNTPHEYGTHWAGFGERYGMRLTGIATSNAMEAGLGAIWGEDPRYWRKGREARFKTRIGHIFKYTFFALDENGQAQPAYARYAAYAGNNFLSNTWREESEADTAHALERTATAFLGRIASNTWDEFWPDIRQKVFRRNAAGGGH